MEFWKTAYGRISGGGNPAGTAQAQAASSKTKRHPVHPLSLRQNFLTRIILQAEVNTIRQYWIMRLMAAPSITT